jgi:hypothetical protein
LYDGEAYRLCFQDNIDPALLYQFVYENEAYRFTGEIRVEGYSKDSLNNLPIALLHGEDAYQFYALNSAEDFVHHAVYDEGTEVYENTDRIRVILPNDNYICGFAMAHGDDSYWMYMMEFDTKTPILNQGGFGTDHPND